LHIHEGVIIMRRIKGFCAAVLISITALVTSGCENIGMKEGLGGLFGAAAGAAVGSQIGGGTGQVIAVVVGTLAGTWVGMKIGGNLDHADKMHEQITTQKALTHNGIGEASSWSNPDSRNSGVVKPTRVFSQNGKTCREFKQIINIDGEKTEAIHVACKEKGGEWRTAKEIVEGLAQ
jgi:surface antigen